MGRLKVGFEQRRGLFMTIGDESGFTRESIDWTQLQMLRRCEVPGLLPIENEELDGDVTFMYDLNGYRMLGEALRVVKWTMTDFMNALCRLAEVLEDCRLYLLDADRILLADEFIFAGGDWQDIRFTYLPVNSASRSEDTLERLVVRWMMRVEDLDGQAMQQVLRIVAARDFVPRSLRSFIRDYLSSASGLRPMEADRSPPLSMMTAGQSGDKPAAISESPKQVRDKPNGLSWRLLQPPSGDPHALSELLGEGRITRVTDNSAKQPMDTHRRRTLTGAGAAVAVAVAWRFGYVDHPGLSGMLLGLGVTIIALACVTLLWNWAPKRNGASHMQSAEPIRKADRPAEWEDEYPDSGAPRFQIHVSEQRMTASDHAVDPRRYDQPAETTWLPSNQSDRTEMLVSTQRKPQTSCYLLWETRGDGSKVQLGEQSVVIGRSAEAAHHVDETYGISRAHVEVLRVAEQWKVKDLGSRNGSKLNDMPMTPYELYSLQPGDSLTLATSQYRFVQEHA